MQEVLSIGEAAIPALPPVALEGRVVGVSRATILAPIRRAHDFLRSRDRISRQGAQRWSPPTLGR